jgi:hypothetical protein
VSSRIARGAYGGVTVTRGASGALRASAGSTNPVANLHTAFERERALRTEIKRLKHRAAWLEESRDYWREEARLWKWGALHRNPS